MTKEKLFELRDALKALEWRYKITNDDDFLTIYYFLEDEIDKLLTDGKDSVKNQPTADQRHKVIKIKSVTKDAKNEEASQ